MLLVLPPALHVGWLAAAEQARYLRDRRRHLRVLPHQHDQPLVGGGARRRPLLVQDKDLALRALLQPLQRRAARADEPSHLAFLDEHVVPHHAVSQQQADARADLLARKRPLPGEDELLRGDAAAR